MKISIPIEVKFDDMKSLINDLGNLQTYKLLESDEMTLVDVEDVADVLAKHVKAVWRQSVKGESMRAIDADSLIRLVEDATILSDDFKKAFIAIVNGEPTIVPEVTDEDLVSRRDLINLLNEIREVGMINPYYDGPRRDVFDEVISSVSDSEILPSKKSDVSAKEPEPKPGWWIDITKTGGDFVWKCSECGELNLEDTYYCPNCGTKMGVKHE